jgi:DNA-binding transcriptional MerR regulator
VVLGDGPQQGALFADPSVAGDGYDADVVVGYRGPTACSAAGITYRQLDYWARTDLVLPTVRTASGSGTQRLYSFKDILVLKVVKRLLDAGVSLQNIRIAVDALRARGVEDLAQVTLLSDGTTVYECTSSEEVVDLLQGGQGVFGIAVSGALRELRGSLAHLPGERADGVEETPVAATANDELSRRRSQRSATA